MASNKKSKTKRPTKNMASKPAKPAPFKKPPRKAAVKKAASRAKPAVKAKTTARAQQVKVAVKKAVAKPAVKKVASRAKPAAKTQQVKTTEKLTPVSPGFSILKTRLKKLHQQREKTVPSKKPLAAEAAKSI